VVRRRCTSTSADPRRRPPDWFEYTVLPTPISRPSGECAPVPFTFADRGPDNVLGNSTTFDVHGAERIGGQLSTDQVTQNAEQNGKYKTFEVSVNKRQSHNYSLGAGFGYTWQHDFPLTFPNTPNGPFDYDYRGAGFKVNATYNAKWGINVSPLFRYQAGANFARTLSVSAPASCACTFSAARGGSLSNTTVYADKYGDNKQDDIYVFDVRVEKSVNLGHGVRLRAFLDGFNLLNKYAAETITVSTGANYLLPTAILGPRTGRIGFRLMW
jgi:hypothetical protein